jgi:predicted PurR-regulated permease PerM
VPFWAPLLLAAWTADLIGRPYRWLSRQLGHNHRGAAVVIVLLVVVALAPLTLCALSLSNDAMELVKDAIRAGSTSSALRTIVSRDKVPGEPLGSMELLDLAQRYGAGVWQVAQTVIGAAAGALLGALVFLLGVFEFLVAGPRISRWIGEHSPLESKHLARFSLAFSQTGRGIIIGVGLTALFQGLIAMVGYFALGIPQAAVLGLLTCFAALVPVVGSSLLWVPVTAGLALTGRPGAAMVMGLIGLLIAVSDNLLRPALSRYGKLEMTTLMFLVSSLGGVIVFGIWGFVLGPLVVRLTTEGVSMLREERIIGPKRGIALVADSTRSD